MQRRVRTLSCAETLPEHRIPQSLSQMTTRTCMQSSSTHPTSYTPSGTTLLAPQELNKLECLHPPALQPCPAPSCPVLCNRHFIWPCISCSRALCITFSPNLTSSTSSISVLLTSQACRPNPKAPTPSATSHTCFPPTASASWSSWSANQSSEGLLTQQPSSRASCQHASKTTSTGYATCQHPTAQPCVSCCPAQSPAS
jgi:hypothetical protein